jgi:hypothetical protein
MSWRGRDADRHVDIHEFGCGSERQKTEKKKKKSGGTKQRNKWERTKKLFLFSELKSEKRKLSLKVEGGYGGDVCWRR